MSEKKSRNTGAIIAGVAAVVILAVLVFFVKPHYLKDTAPPIPVAVTKAHPSPSASPSTTPSATVTFPEHAERDPFAPVPGLNNP